MNKRTFLKSVLLGATGVFAVGLFSTIKAARTRKKWDGEFRLPELPYSYNALEPFMEAETLKSHHLHLHSGYTRELNEAVINAGLVGKSAYQLLKDSSIYPEAIRNSSGAYLNHKLFWRILAPATGKRPSYAMTTAIERDFGSIENFKASFGKAAKTVSGSGWAWVITDKYGRLKITTTSGHVNPVMDIARDRGIPILCLDVWDHAINSQDQDQYISAFWDVVNWDAVSTRYSYSIKNL